MSVTTGGPATLLRAPAPRAATLNERIAAPTPPPTAPAGVLAHDGLLPPDEQKALLTFLKGPGWAYGAFSDVEGSRYLYKHFAGVVIDGREAVDPAAFETTLEKTAPLVASLWRRLKAEQLRGHKLTRCYANGYPVGSEGGLHRDSNIATHYTAIYYPHLSWKPNYAGETVFFDDSEQEIIASVYPKPNRLVVFPGIIPHVARGVSRACPDMRITLMFKTMV
ncbi:MAG TPA: 2OG-Fe(II) oxygenase [Caulobacteraceae bacterium]|nr:2OG-Fe(II) oxygenase [Caulobacteraceae bacterium]